MKILDIDIGCGKNKYKGKKGEKVIGMDIVKLRGVDIIHDLEKFPWPFKDNEFDMIVANNTLEHVSNFVKTMEEIWRITRNGGIVKLIVPYHTSIGANTDPTHKIFFAYRSLNYFCKGSYNFDFYTKKKFELIKIEFLFHNIFFIFKGLFNRFPRFYERFFRYLIPAEEIKFILRKS